MSLAEPDLCYTFYYLFGSGFLDCYFSMDSRSSVNFRFYVLNCYINSDVSSFVFVGNPLLELIAWLEFKPDLFNSLTTSNNDISLSRAI